MITEVKQKTRYDEKIASTEFYTKYSGDRPWKITPIDRLKAKRDHLKTILDTGEIDTSGMDIRQTEVVSYEFQPRLAGTFQGRK